jgi:uncharacterized SAM-binding protein YcdF (DUF218 family)
MFLALSKFLPLFAYPLGLGLLLLILALIVRRPQWRKVAILSALIVLYLGSNRWAAVALARSLEWRYVPSGELPSAQAIVLLGGASQSAQPPRPIVEVNEAGDRILYAAWLYQQGKAAHILLSGGRIDWLSSGRAPAEDMSSLLQFMNVPADAMWLEDRSRNTYENALFSRQILEPKGIDRIILVTSAMHMPRAVGLFERQGFEVIPAPVDFNATFSPVGEQPNLGTALLDLIPSVDNLELTSRVMKEYFGLIVYRLRGWL